jgi:hypothetical protein
MPESVVDILRRLGPSRSSLLTGELLDQGVSPEAARQRLSRLRPPIRKFPVTLLPKKEGFFYLDNQRNREAFWVNFLRDMRATGSVYGLALDGLLARGGAVAVEHFPVISGAPTRPLRGQVDVDRLLSTLKAATLVEEFQSRSGRDLIRFKGWGNFDEQDELADGVLLDGLREWVRNVGFASYNSIAIRGEAELGPIGPFMFDLAGASYLSPLHPGDGKPGFFVADVFSSATLDEHQIGYFIRKAKMLRSLNVGVLPMIVAFGFTGAALRAGHAAGISLATPYTLFGRRVALALASLAQMLSNAAAYASSDTPNRLIGLLSELQDMQGRAGNLRGILFELVSAYLARRGGGSIEMGVTATDPQTGKKADIDILRVTEQGSHVTCIECKGREPGGVVDLLEVQEWIRKTSIMRGYLSSHRSLREASVSFQMWTSGTFHPDALSYLVAEKEKRVRVSIDWKDGTGVLAVATEGKEKAISDALREHFLDHPLSKTARPQL